MKAYIAPEAVNFLATALSTSTLNSLVLTGYSIGSASGFVPDKTMQIAQGVVLINKVNTPRDIFITPLGLHEITITVKLDQTYAFNAVGNILIMMNNRPFLWSVARSGLSKVKTDGVAHFGGDEYYFPIVFRYPNIDKLIKKDQNTYRNANFPIFPDIEYLSPPGHTLCDQVHVEANSIAYGNDRPFIANRHDQVWRSTPLMEKLGTNRKYIDGGTSKSGL